MGNSEEGKSSKPEKSSSPAADQNQTNVHVYPDWTAMQAYYGPQVTVPPYFNSAIASGQVPHPYMWGPPQPMMPPYGVPYAAIYSHGGVYAHPGVPLESHSIGHGGPASPVASEAMIPAASPLSMDTPAKSSGNTDQGLLKKLKVFDGLAMSIGNGNASSAEGGVDHGLSQSGETAGSSDGSDENTVRASQNGKKRSREGTPNAAGDVKTQTKSSPIPRKEGNGDSEKVMSVNVAPVTPAGKVMGTTLLPDMTTSLELRNIASVNVRTSPISSPRPCQVIPHESWLQNERELKRERRKQSNRESARRSRLRRQADAEELAVKVESLTAENKNLKSEVNRLIKNSDKLKLENATLMEKLRNEQLVQKNVTTLDKVDDKTERSVNTENLLATLNNSSSVDRKDENSGTHENRNSGAKLHQLMDASPRTDAVVAG